VSFFVSFVLFVVQDSLFCLWASVRTQRPVRSLPAARANGDEASLVSPPPTDTTLLPMISPSPLVERGPGVRPHIPRSRGCQPHQRRGRPMWNPLGLPCCPGVETENAPALHPPLQVTPPTWKPGVKPRVSCGAAASGKKGVWRCKQSPPTAGEPLRRKIVSYTACSGCSGENGAKGARRSPLDPCKGEKGRTMNPA